MNRPAKWLLIGGLLILSATPISANPQDPISQPNMDLLEFLGNWETEDGQWMDPIELLEGSPDDVEQDRGSSVETEELPTDDIIDENMDNTLSPQFRGSQHE